MGGQAAGTGVVAHKGHPGAPTDRGRSNTATQNAGATPGGTKAGAADKEEGGSKAGRATRTAGTLNQNVGDGRACAWGAATTEVGGVPCSPDGLFAQREEEPTRGRPAVRGKWTCGGRPGQRVEEQGTWASHTRKCSKAGYGRPEDRGVWTAQKQSNDPRNNQCNLNTSTTGRR